MASLVKSRIQRCTLQPSDCSGPARRFSTCNTQPCPAGAGDFREEQCAKYNTELFERKYYDWVPYLKAPRKCELNCMPKGERFYYRHASKVCIGLLCYGLGEVRLLYSCSYAIQSVSGCTSLNWRIVLQ